MYEVKVDIFTDHKKVDKELYYEVDGRDEREARANALALAKLEYPGKFYFAWPAVEIMELQKGA